MRCVGGRWSHVVGVSEVAVGACLVSSTGASTALAVRSSDCLVESTVRTGGNPLCLGLRGQLDSAIHLRQSRCGVRMPSRNCASGESSSITFSMLLPHGAGLCDLDGNVQNGVAVAQTDGSQVREAGAMLCSRRLVS